jgi:nucleoside 2-deoxyribosyltransferase
MMIEVKAPDSSAFERFKKIFLAGSIEMGAAEPWQEKLAEALQDQKVILFNPRRPDWDSSWVQDPTPGTPFSEQVNWELDHIERADAVAFYFDPNTKSPITLLELGLMVKSGKRLFVCCPDGYFRKGNVVITCNRAAVPVLNSFGELVSEIRNYLE